MIAMPTRFSFSKLVPGLIIVAILASYSQLFLNDFINYDDPAYIVNNPHLISTEISPYLWALSSTYASNWHPLTWWLHAANVTLFGFNPAGHHAINLLLHSANSLLLFLILRRSTSCEYQSIFVTLLFALHPLHVESVAWAAELKDVLCTFFWLLTMYLYVIYSEKPTLRKYMLLVLAFIAGLSAKAMIITLPFVLFLFDFWPLGRLRLKRDGFGFETCNKNSSLRGLILEKVPLAVMAAAVSGITLFAQKAGGSLDSFAQTGTVHCIGNALISYIAYLKKMFWPVDLAVVYPFELSAITLTSVTVSTLLLLAITAASVMKVRTHPYLLVGWLWYLVTLLPVIGIIRLGHQGMADRYTYIPSIGIFVIAAWCIKHLATSFTRQKPLLSVSYLLLLPLMITTWIQTGYWRNSTTLFTHAINCTDNNWMAYNNLGADLLRHGNYAQAVQCFKESIRTAPFYADSHNNLGIAYDKCGNHAEGIFELQKAASLSPDNPGVRYNLGLAYYQSGHTERAIAEGLILQKLNDPRAPELLSIIASHKPVN